MRTARHTSHTCDRCRLKRAKCSGGDRCVRCLKDNAKCQYSDRKRDRNRKDLAENTSRIITLESRISELAETVRNASSGNGLSPEECTALLYSLEEAAQQDENNSLPDKPRDHGSLRSSLSGASCQEGSTGSFSTISPLPNGGTLQQIASLGMAKGTAGFIGQFSEISWMQSVREYLIGAKQEDFLVSLAAVGHHSEQAPSLSYFMDESDLLSIDEDGVEEHEWPTPQTAILLSEAYFHSTHDAFPFVDRASFFKTMSHFDRHRRVQSWAERRWLAAANVVWSIGAKWLQLAKLGGFTESHLMYYARARALGLDHRVLMAHADLESVQSMGLLSYYLFINGSIARAWTMLGHATRHLTALGLHIDVAAGAIDDKGRQKRARVLYSLYSLEVLLAEVTGRPKSLVFEDITSSIDILEDSLLQTANATESPTMDSPPSQVHLSWLRYLSAYRNLPQAMTGGILPWRNFRTIGHGVSPGYFLHRVRLCKISHRISSSLYTGSHRLSWFGIQQEIEKLEIDLREWRDIMPQELDIRNTAPTTYDPRPKIEIAMYYHSVEMILYRPCMSSVIFPDQPKRSKEFDHSAARACVRAATEMLDLLPDKPTDHECYQLLPSWALLHYICQAAAVLALELSLDLQHFQKINASVVAVNLRKALVYMRCLSQSSLSAYKARRIFHLLAVKIQAKYGYAVVQDDPLPCNRPGGWNEADERRLSEVFLYTMTSEG